ncbi:DEAD/DEAH box helicase [Cellulomonas denverensis]|uniref:DEAD/DEAH box helicase n=1 Tax=Cellulomonas denverensis TaxID=264297 RepID=A0A7X6KVW5_9CELL|nr:DEAD/DEAH box helicase [Cellulomonas denverensis]NKY22790.1 DEAD/DEAH box helicase [Cellulomonas denverensis]GIG26254.1 DNA helicase [Cellulomonas denverensis]
MSSPPSDRWREVLGSLVASVTAESAPPAAEPTTATGLQFELRELTPRTRERWNGPTSRTVGGRARRDDPPGNGQYRLAVRPVLRTTKGWARGNVTWTNIPHQRTRLGLDPAQHRWFCEVGALHRAAGPALPGTDPDWVFLDEFANPVLWDLLDQARELGIAFVGSGIGAQVRVGDRAELTLDAARADDAIRLTARLTVDGEPADPRHAHPIGDHGLYVADPAQPRRILLAPVTAPLDAQQLALLGTGGRRSVADALGDGVLVPAEQIGELLGTALDLRSADGSVSIPPPAPPTLVLTVRFAPRHTVELGWSWRSAPRSAPAPDPRSLIPAGTLPVGWWSEDGLPLPVSLRDVEAAEFVAVTLPLIDALPGVAVETVGTRPDYRELRGDPVLTVTTVPTEKHDWFDLGVTVTLEGRDIPFVPLFRALAQGRKKLMLVDGSYFALDHPALATLSELITEARDLGEWETGPRISRHQTSLWADFVDLADQATPAVQWRALVEEAAADAPRPTPPPRGLRARLRPYQQDGLDWLAFLWRHRLGGILADDMGLGKTVQCLALIQHAVESGSTGPFLVVAPTSVTPNWVAEAARFTPGLRVRRIAATQATGVRVADLARDADLVVTSYALLRLDAEAYAAVDWAGLVLDEAQQVKNHSSQVHRAARDLGAPFTLAVTGTPIENSLTELHALLALTAPGLFPSARAFAERYLRPIEGERTGVTAGRGAGSLPSDLGRSRQERLAQLRRRVRPFLLRRTKELVAADLPGKQEQTLTVELSPAHRDLYDLYLQRERQKLFGLIDDLDRQRFIVYRSLTLLRMLALDPVLIDPEQTGIGSAKLDLLLEQLDDLVAEGHRALVFSQFTSYLDLAAERLTAAGVPFVHLDGSTTGRERVIEEFRTGDAPVFLISLKAGGTGLNLTEADYVFLLDPWWNPAAEQQAIDRTHRIGQDKHVMVYRLIAAGTIEEKVQALQARKAELVSAVIDDGNLFSAALTAQDVRDLLG